MDRANLIYKDEERKIEIYKVRYWYNIFLNWEQIGCEDTEELAIKYADWYYNWYYAKYL